MYSQFDPYGAGRKVYSNGSYAPTRGQVDPRGYIQRGVRQRAKQQSQSRSGLAQRALRTMTQAGNGGRPVDPNTGRQPYQNEGRPMQNDGRKMFQNEGRPILGADGKPVGAGAPKADPYIKINSNGQLDLPYNEQYSWDVLNNTQQMNQQLLDLQLQQQAQAQEYTQSRRQAGLDYTDLARRTLASDTGRGMAFSSGHANNVANNARQYNNMLSGMDAKNLQFNQGIGLGRAQIEAAFNDMLRQSALQQAQGLVGQAGDLGFGQAVAAPGTLPGKKLGTKKPGFTGVGPKVPSKQGKKRKPHGFSSGGNR